MLLAETSAVCSIDACCNRRPLHDASQHLAGLISKGNAAMRLHMCLGNIVNLDTWKSAAALSRLVYTSKGVIRCVVPCCSSCMIMLPGSNKE